MGLLIKVLKDSDTKPQYEVTLEVDPGAISVSDGQIAMFFGSELNAHRVSADSSGRKNMQALREVGWPNPGLGLVNMAAMKWTESIPTVALGSAGVPALDESYVALILGADFTVSGNSNSAHCHRMLENFAGTVDEAPALATGLVISGETGGLSGGDCNIGFEGASINATIDWRDGSPIENITVAGVVSHTYAGGGGALFQLEINGAVGFIDLSEMVTPAFSGTSSWRFDSWGDGSVVFNEGMADFFFALIVSTQDGEYLGFGSPDLSNLTDPDMDSFFQSCDSLWNLNTELDLTTWDFSAVTTITSLFQQATPGGDIEVGNIILTGIDFGNVVGDVSQAFNLQEEVRLTGATDISLSSGGVTNLTNFMFGAIIPDGDHLDFTDWDLTSLTNFTRPFAHMVGAFTMSLNGLSNPVPVSCVGAWEGAAGITNLDLDGTAFAFSSTANMFRFSDANNTPAVGPTNAIDISGWDLSTATQGTDMFAGCRFSSINVTGWTTTLWTTLNQMFQDSGNITMIGMDTWDLSSVGIWHRLFQRSLITTLDMSAWDVSGMTAAVDTFSESELDSASLDSFLEACYASRLTSQGGIALNFTISVNGLSGVYQDAVTPTTGLEWAFKLNTDPDTEGFTLWAITDVGIP